MSPTTALWVLTWIAIVVLYLCLAAVLREVRLLRSQVARLQASPSGENDAEALPTSLTEDGNGIVLVADSSCPLCRLSLARLGELSEQLPARPVVLTHEAPDQWDEVPAGVRLVRDERAWSSVAHMAPPVLLRLAPDGTVLDTVLPVNERDIDSAVLRWTATTASATPKG